MSDVEARKTRKIVERKKYQWVVNLLKESVDTTTISKRILDLEINLTVWDLIASALAIKKQFIKAITEDKAIQFRVNILEFCIADAQKAP